MKESCNTTAARKGCAPRVEGQPKEHRWLSAVDAQKNKPVLLELELVSKRQVSVQMQGKIKAYLCICGYSGGRVFSTSVFHQCGPGSIPGLGSDPSAVSEKGFVPV